MKHFVIYVPGLGDNKYLVQGILVWFWRLYGVSSVTRTMNWADRATFEEKLTRLLVEIDEHIAKGHKVSLIGASAGAGAVVNAYASRADQINGVVIICGKILHPETVSDRTYGRNPTFKQSMDALAGSISSLNPMARTKILNLHPIYDPTVPVADTKIDGSQEKTTKTTGHSVSILVALSFYGHTICKFLKQQPYPVVY